MRIDNINGGLAGKILRVNLSNKEIWTEDTNEYAKRFIGGRGINSYILLNEMSPQTRWSDPENMLIFGVGCLVGTLAPGACRVSIDTKSAFCDGKGSANFGGHFGPELKYTGFDHVVITGSSRIPVYLWITDGDVELRDASSVWGRTTDETEKILQKELFDEKIEIASIGPAGENLVRGSCVVGDLAKVAGGSGVGCVMGSKKLKALVARGHGSIKVAEPKRFINAANSAFAKIKSSPTSESWRKGIMESYYFPESKLWDVCDAIKNGQEAFWPIEKRVRLAGKITGVPKYKKNVVSCFSCPIGCIPFFEIDDGKYKGSKGMGYWITSANHSIKLDIDDPASSLKFHFLTNQLGLDGDMATTVIAWAFECYEKGLLTEADTDGLELEWGNEEATIKMVEKLAYRKGIGDFLADGVREASRKLGKGSEEFALYMKGQDTADHYRIQKGWGFGCSTSPVGGRHLRGAVGTVQHSGPKDLPRSTNEYTNQPEAVFWELRAKEIEDMTGLCNMMGTYTGARALEPSDYAELTNSALGIELSEEEFMFLGRSTYNLEKAFNTIHADFTRQDDYPPKRYMEEPIKSGPYAGYKCDKEKWDEMLDKFYELQGWDKNTSWQTYKCLIELGLEDIANKLEKAGKLIYT
ncbi:aldehyde ferredoxin oxidoreductase family protein [Chloroflexota bacterium]